MLTVPKGPQRPEEESAAQRFREEVGQRIEAAMKAAKLNHRTLAERAGIDRSLITRLINGERRANGDQLVKLAAALGVSAASFMPGRAPMTDTVGGVDDLSPPKTGVAGMRAPPRDRAPATIGQQIAEVVDALPEKEHKLEALRRVLNYVSELRDPQPPAAEEIGNPHRARPR